MGDGSGDEERGRRKIGEEVAAGDGAAGCVVA